MVKRDVIHGNVLISACLFFSAAMCASKDAHAFRFQDGEVRGYLETMISASIGMRAEARNPKLIGITKGGTDFSSSDDRGDLNYARGALTRAVMAGVSDLGLTYHNISTFVRVSYFVDPVNLYKNGLNSYQRQQAGKALQLGDAYVEGKLEPGDHELNVRAGKQTLNWGEALFIPGGLSVINAVDIGKLMAAGDRVIDALLSEPMVSASYQMTQQFSLAGYYMFKYDKDKFPVCGTYFSTSDAACEGGANDFTSGWGMVPKGTPGWINNRLPDDKPRDQGQFGLAMRYLAAQFNDIELGVYALNYHNHVPVFSAVSVMPGGVPSYQLQYLPNLQTYGVTMTVDVFGMAFQGEYTYRPRFPLQIEANEIFSAAAYFPGAQVPAATAPGEVVRGYRQFPINQLQGNLTKTIGHDNIFKADHWDLAAEAAMIYVSHFPKKNNLRFEAPQTNLSAYDGIGSPALQSEGWADCFSWGYVFSSSWTYLRAIDHIDLVPHVAFSHDVEGTTPSPLSQFVHDRVGGTFGLTARYMARWSTDVSYSLYAGAGARNTLNDRDQVNMTVRYWF